MKINLAINKRLIPEDKARAKAKRRLGAMDPNSVTATLCYKKLYFLKVMAYASRVPFPPKKRPYVVFFDSYLSLNGVTYGVPEYEKKNVPDSAVLPDKVTRESFEQQQNYIIEQRVLKQYLLKRPEIKVEGIEEIYLPYYKCTFNGKVTFINAATGKHSL